MARGKAREPSDKRVMTDAQVAAFFGIDTATVRRRLARPVKGEVDLNAAHPCIVGGRRLWLREDVESLLLRFTQQRKGARA